MSERIWISSEVVDVAGFDLPDHDDPTEVEYIRADIHEAALATARREARDEALEEALSIAAGYADECDRLCAPLAAIVADEIATRIRALRTQDAPDTTRASTGAPGGGMMAVPPQRSGMCPICGCGHSGRCAPSSGEGL